MDRLYQNDNPLKNGLHVSIFQQQEHGPPIPLRKIAQKQSHSDERLIVVRVPSVKRSLSFTGMHSISP